MRNSSFYWPEQQRWVATTVVVSGPESGDPTVQTFRLVGLLTSQAGKNYHSLEWRGSYAQKAFDRADIVRDFRFPVN